MWSAISPQGLFACLMKILRRSAAACLQQSYRRSATKTLPKQLHAKLNAKNYWRGEGKRIWCRPVRSLSVLRWCPLPGRYSHHLLLLFQTRNPSEKLARLLTCPPALQQMKRQPWLSVTPKLAPAKPRPLSILAKKLPVLVHPQQSGGLLQLNRWTQVLKASTRSSISISVRQT